MPIYRTPAAGRPIPRSSVIATSPSISPPTASARRPGRFAWPAKPRRVIPQAIGITEIVWAIMPRDRIIAVHKSCKDPRFSFIAKSLPAKLPTYGTEDAEIVIGFKPDLVLTSFYSNENFLRQLQVARVPACATGLFRRPAGYRGTDPAHRPSGRRRAQRQATGRHHGSQAASNPGVCADPETGRQPPFDRCSSTTTWAMWPAAARPSIPCAGCSALPTWRRNGAVKYFKQIDYETLLKWNPDIIIVPRGEYFRSATVQPAHSRHGQGGSAAQHSQDAQRLPAERFPVPGGQRELSGRLAVWPVNAGRGA
jgi:hypothetical protein